MENSAHLLRVAGSRLLPLWGSFSAQHLPAAPRALGISECFSLYRDQRPILGRKIHPTMNNKVICRNLFCFLFIANGNREEEEVTGDGSLPDSRLNPKHQKLRRS